MQSLDLQLTEPPVFPCVSKYVDQTPMWIQRNEKAVKACDERIRESEGSRKRLRVVSLIAIPIVTVLGVLLSGAFSSLWFSMSSFYILPKMQACKAFYKIIVVALPVIFTSGLVPSVLTFLFMGFFTCRSVPSKIGTGDEAQDKYEKNIFGNAISMNLILAVSTIFLILINTLTFGISSYKPMNLKRCLITIAVVNGLVALTSFLATISISIMSDKLYVYDIKSDEKTKDKLEKEIAELKAQKRET